MSINTIPDKDTSGNILAPYSHPFRSSNGFRARYFGFSGTAAKCVAPATEQTTSIDYLITEERWINGARFVLSGHVDGDSMDFQVVDKDGVGVGLGWYDQATWDAMPGGEYVADTFGDHWYVDASQSVQADIKTEFPARIYTGLYMRIVYRSTGLVNDVSVHTNIYAHKKTT